MSERAGRDAENLGARAWPAAAWKGPLLVIRLSSLGDVILATGPLRRLRESYPALPVDFLTRRAYASLLRDCPWIDRVILADGDPQTTDPPASRGAAGGAPRGYGIVLDWQGGWKGRQAAQRHAPGVPRIVAPQACLRRRMLVVWGRRLRAPEPYVVRLARSYSGQALPRADLAPRVAVDPALAENLRRRMSEVAAPPSGWLVLASAAAHPAKAVPEALAAALELSFLQRGWGVIRIEPPGADVAPGMRARKKGEDSLRFAGTLPEVAALLSAARLFIGGDTGIMHLAGAVGVPSIGLFGPTVPELGYAPLGRSLAIGVDLACRPCHIHGARTCWLGHIRCWKDLECARIVAAAEDLLDAGGHRAGGWPGH
ncbi:MAG: glycosyltransferase family 9 protein [Candidatus Eisenbacteria bacterium]